MEIELLDLLIDDEKKINNPLYSSGLYWKHKNKRTIREIKNKTLKNFRGSDNGIGTSFSDNMVSDIRNEYNLKGKLISLFYKIPIISKVFEQQLNITHNAISNYLDCQKLLFENDKRVHDLLKKFKFNNTTEFGCLQKFKYKKKDISTHYLEMANRVDKLSKYFNFSKIRTYFEIGGGFGANIHFLLQNFPNIKKIIYLDSVPNLYVGTEYLRKFYNKNIVDYRHTRNLKEIKFSQSSKLEIFCIAPWQIEMIKEKVDHFHNAASFVEMPEDIVKNYINHLKRLKTKDISLISYLEFDKKTTFNPKKLRGKFGKKLLKMYCFDYVINKLKLGNIYIIGKNIF